MKTTLEIADPLLAEAKAMARKQKITSVTGNGLRPDAAELSWDQLRALTYEGQGG